MNRRGFLMAALAGPVLGGVSLTQSAQAQTTGGVLPLAADHPLQANWQAWKALCLSPEGRVIDGFQENASHSEGQGYGLTLAAAFGDDEAAARIIRWTEANLAVRDDRLLAWRWLPDAAPHIADRNNASDGDLFYAWGLIRAAALSEGKARTARAEGIVQDLLRRCVTSHPDGSHAQVFLPGASGFHRPEGIVINPSYHMGQAMRDLAAACAVPAFARLADDGDRLIAELAARGPVPDWVMLTPAGVVAAPAPFSGVSGYEAVRVPLFALWSHQTANPALTSFAAAMAAAGSTGGTPTVFATQGHNVLERSAHPGYAAVAALAACVTSGEVGSLVPNFTADQPYYPATLHLMALVVQVSTYPRCVPI